MLQIHNEILLTWHLPHIQYLLRQLEHLVFRPFLVDYHFFQDPYDQNVVSERDDTGIIED